MAVWLALSLAACSADETPGAGDRRRPGSDDSGGSAGFGSGPGQGGTGSPIDRLPIGEGCSAFTETAVNQRQPADIIFAIDNSGSMDEEIVFVREQMNAFSQQIVDSGIDVRIIVISAPLGGSPDSGGDDDDDDDEENGICIDPPLGSGSCPNDSNSPRYLHVPEEVGSSDALNLFIDTYPEWRDQLRPNATKTFVVVTDDDATDEPIDSAAAFTEAVAELDAELFRDWSFSGIYCFSECPEAAEIGLVYMDLVAERQGVAGDLCLQDFAPVFDALARSVIDASGLDCAWDIPEPPPGQSFAIGRVNVHYTPSSGAGSPIYHVPSSSDCGAQGGWYYDNNTAPERILVCPATCDVLQADTGAKVDVLFGCETLDGPE